MAVFIDLWPYSPLNSAKFSCLNKVTLLQLGKGWGPRLVEMTPPNIWLAVLFEPIFLSTSKVKSFFKFSLISHQQFLVQFFNYFISILKELLMMVRQ